MPIIETEIGENFEVKSLDLADKGLKVMNWAASRMPVLQQIKTRFKKEKPLAGVVIGACLHVTKETSQLCETWLAGGAEVYLCASNPLTTQDEIAAALVKKGVKVFAWKYMDDEGYYRSISNVIKANPHITVDDGADLVSTLHKLDRGDDSKEIDLVKKYLGEKTDFIKNVWGGAEETTTGVIRLRAMAKEGALKYPILATNDLTVKWEFDNIWGTGQSTIDGILRATADLIASKIFVVAGYGHCGRGVALRAKGLGARRVIVSEIDPYRALTAVMEGIEVMPMKEAAKIGDIFVTATGNKNVIRREHFELMKDGVVVCNTGHFNVEINVRDLEEMAVGKEKPRTFVDQYILSDGRRINLLAEGRLINLAAAEGHSPEVMDLSFAGQALASEYIVKNKNKFINMTGEVLNIPSEIDISIAYAKCDALGITLDQLTEEQERYLNGWQEGT